RPINVDRAVALFRADLRADGVEELLSAVEYFRRDGRPASMSVAVDLFRLFERDKWALLLARNIADESREAPHDNPEFRRVWYYAYPTPFQGEVDKACRDNGVDRFLAYAVMRTESRYRPDAVSPVGARGLM